MRVSQVEEEMEEGGEWDALTWLASRMRTVSIVTWSSLSIERLKYLHTTCLLRHDINSSRNAQKIVAFCPRIYIHVRISDVYEKSLFKIVVCPKYWSRIGGEIHRCYLMLALRWHHG
jgi:hypothetical protein